MAHILGILLWKHLTVRARRFIHTPVELLSPLFFFILPFALKGSVFSNIRVSNATFHGPVQRPEPFHLKDAHGPKLILYTPDNTLTQELISKAALDLGLEQKLSTLDHYTRGYYGLPSNFSMSDYLKTIKPDDAIVIFENMNDDKLPDRLNYTIRIKAPFQTHIRNSLDDKFEPHMRFGTIYEPFMRLQWAIDSSYIEMLSGQPVSQTVSLQEFPFVNKDSAVLVALKALLLSSMCYLSLLLIFVFLTTRLMEEKASGIQELMKMVGVSSNMLSIAQVINVMPIGVLYAVVPTILMVIKPYAFVENSNSFLLGLMLFLYFITVIAMAFACSYIVRGSNFAASLAVFLYMVLYLPAYLLCDRQMNKRLVMLVGLLPHAPMRWYWHEYEALEMYGQGVTFSTFTESHSAYSSSVAMCYVYMLLQTAFFSFITWYLSLVRPGRHGTPLPWDFLFRKEYWNKNEVVPDDDVEERQYISSNSKYFESPPPNSEVGIEVANVTKAYNQQRVLKNVTLKVFRDEITVLLGHNGAGKTTLMSIITGITKPTEGNVFVNGIDVSSSGAKVHNQIGFCPQHNMFFSDLTVYEHVKFFSLLKGVAWSKAKFSSIKLLEKLGLADKATALPNQLSGGMKRRLQLACALAGETSVLVLDEPTSGLDVETRRGLWDLLLTLRTGKTVLLSTHFMEEADALGDRVAALHLGDLRCYATPMHLKKEIDTGYRLSITLEDSGRKVEDFESKEKKITTIVTGAVPRATLLQESGENTIAYNLPSKDTSQFRQLFSTLESKRDELGIKSIGISISTLEEVFIQLCSDMSASGGEDEIDGKLKENPLDEKLTGFKLYARQFAVLYKRQIRYVMSKKVMFLFMHVIVPIAMLCAFTKMSNGTEDASEENLSIQLNMNLYNDIPDRRALASINVSSPTGRSDTLGCCNVAFERTSDVAETILRVGKKDQLEYNKYFIGLEINDTDAKALYTTTVRHAAPVALNALSNVIAAKLLPLTSSSTITTMNHPIQDETIAKLALVLPKSKMMAICWAVFIAFIIQTTLMEVVSLPCSERASGTRHLHIVSGCKPEMHWMVTLTFHFTVAMAVVIIPTIIANATLDTDKLLNQSSAIVALLIVLVLGCLAFIAFCFWVSFFLKVTSVTLVLIACCVVFGFVGPMMRTSYDMLSVHPDTFYYALEFFKLTIPSFTFTYGMLETVNVARLNKFCSLNLHLCPNLVVPEKGFDVYKCCTLKTNPQGYFEFTEYSPLFSMLLLFLQFIFYMLLVILTERGVFNIMSSKIFNYNFRPIPPEQEEDKQVIEEKLYVKQNFDKSDKDTLLVHDVHKRYTGPFKKKIHAVKGISFAVRKGECFGLVGMNGAGKSTTFKMMTCEEFPTIGHIRNSNGPQRCCNNDQYLSALGYCPQFFGLDTFMTGRENLSLMLTLNGLNAKDVNTEVQFWLELVELSKYADLAVSGYSGGCARRLAATCALARRAPLALLDEPTAGVDTAARRRLWRGVRTAQARQPPNAVLITSHSMDEMEALCTRIAIMYKGRVVALDSPSALRAQHAAGVAVTLKLRQDVGRARDVTDGASLNIQNLKKMCLDMKWAPKDEYKTILHYHIDKSLNVQYSQLFATLEEMRKQYPDIIEDYSVTDTTLEQVFLSFAKAPLEENSLP